MKRFTSIMVLVIATALLAGCPKKPTIVKEEAAAPAKAPEEAVAKAEADEAKARAEAEAKAKKEAEDRARAEAEVRAREEAAAAAKAKVEAEAEAKAFRLVDVYFDLDKYDVTGKNRDIIKGLGEWLTKNKAKIAIEGHCDERGTNEYNLALGERRANSVKQYLITLGVNASRLSTISYGEEKPLCTETSEECRQKNRRAHFVVKE